MGEQHHVFVAAHPLNRPAREGHQERAGDGDDGVLDSKDHLAVELQLADGRRRFYKEAVKIHAVDAGDKNRNKIADQCADQPAVVPGDGEGLEDGHGFLVRIAFGEFHALRDEVDSRSLVAEALEVHRGVVVVGPSRTPRMRQALIKALVEPVDVGVIEMHPRVVGVRRLDMDFAVRLEIPEALG